MPRLLLLVALTAGALSASEDEPSLCSLESLPCPARGQVSLCQKCDGTRDCKAGCRRGSAACERRGWRCGRGGPCLPFEHLCDGQRNCPDGSDEGEPLCGHWTALPQPACEKDEFRCGPGADCFPLAFVCDGHPDCEDGWDEAGCVTETSAQATPEGIFTTPKTLETVGLEPLTVAAIAALLLLLGAAAIPVWLSAKGRPLLARAPPAKASEQLLAEDLP